MLYILELISKPYQLLIAHNWIGLLLILIIMFFIRNLVEKKYEIIVASVLSFLVLLFLLFIPYDMYQDKLKENKLNELFKKIENNRKVYINGEEILNSQKIIDALMKKERILSNRPKDSGIEILIEIRSEKVNLEFHVNRDSKYKDEYKVYLYNKTNDSYSSIGFINRIRTSILSKYIPKAIRQNINQKNFINFLSENIKEKNIYIDGNLIKNSNKLIKILNNLYSSDKVFSCYKDKSCIRKDNKNIKSWNVVIENEDKQIEIIIEETSLKNTYEVYIPTPYLHRRIYTYGYIQTDFFNKFTLKDDKLTLDKYLIILNKKINIYGKKSLKIARIYNKIAQLYYHENKYEKSIDFYNKSIKIKLPLLGWKHISLLSDYEGLAKAWEKKKNYNISREFYKKSFSMMSMIYHPKNYRLKKNYNSIKEVEKQLKKKQKREKE